MINTTITVRYDEISTDTKAFYKWSNDNHVCVPCPVCSAPVALIATSTVL